MAFQKYSEEKRNEILDSQQEKNAREKNIKTIKTEKLQ